MNRKNIKTIRTLLFIITIIISMLCLWGCLIAYFTHNDWIIGVLAILWFVAMFSIGYIDDILEKGLK